MGFAFLTDGAVKVIHGSNDGVFDVAGHNVATVHRSLVDAFNIPTKAVAFVNGEQVDAGYTLQAHDTLEFCKRAASKGVTRMFTKAELFREYIGVPQDVLNELVAVFSHHDTNAAGESLWLEYLVDGWLRDYYSLKAADDGRNKVIPPSSARLGGQVYDGFSQIQWRLLEAIIDKSGVEIDDVIVHVYGHDADSKEEALTQVIKRLNKKLLDHRCPFIISEENGFVTIKA